MPFALKQKLSKRLLHTAKLSFEVQVCSSYHHLTQLSCRTFCLYKVQSLNCCFNRVDLHLELHRTPKTAFENY